MESQYKLLIIDDDEETRNIYREFFTDEGFFVDTAADGIEGLEKLLHNEFDVAIVDIKMPKMDGIEMIRQALTNDRVGASMIILTGHGDREEAVQAVNIGVEAWFDKLNLNMAQLLKRVNELAEVIPIETVRQVLTETRR
jgi:DNA-binding response OmpR family regulator